MPTLGAGRGAAPIPSEGTRSATPGRTGDGGAAKALHRAAKSLLCGESTAGSVAPSSSPAALSKRRSLSCCPASMVHRRCEEALVVRTPFQQVQPSIEASVSLRCFLVSWAANPAPSALCLPFRRGPSLFLSLRRHVDQSTRAASAQDWRRGARKRLRHVCRWHPRLL